MDTVNKMLKIWGRNKIQTKKSQNLEGGNLGKNGYQRNSMDK